jgi:hypothetical protein
MVWVLDSWFSREMRIMELLAGGIILIASIIAVYLSNEEEKHETQV